MRKSSGNNRGFIGAPLELVHVRNRTGFFTVGVEAEHKTSATAVGRDAGNRWDQDKIEPQRGMGRARTSGIAGTN